MKVYLAFEDSAREYSWQDEFPKTTVCAQKGCKGNCRLAFVGHEDYRKGGRYVCHIYENMKDKKLWPHDCVAVAVYFCEKCLEPTALYNQA